MVVSNAAYPPTHVLALLETGDHTCEVLEISESAMTVKFATSAQVSGTVRSVFDHDGAEPGRVRMLSAVQTASTDETGAMEVELRHLALHSVAGKECLREFLGQALDMVDVDERAFKEGAGGWFYGFRATRPSAVSPSRRIQRGQVEVDSQRREQRVAVRVSVQFTYGPSRYVGQAYNVSHSGVYILCDDVLPHQGAHVLLTFPVALHAKPFPVKLEGEVVWSMAAMTASRGGGFGLRLSVIEDGAGGEAWKEYVTKEAEFGGVVKIG